MLPLDECSYVFRQPPFGGAGFQSLEQRAQARRVAALSGSGGTLDYVTAWFIRAGASARPSRRAARRRGSASWRRTRSRRASRSRNSGRCCLTSPPGNRVRSSDLRIPELALDADAGGADRRRAPGIGRAEPAAVVAASAESRRGRRVRGGRVGRRVDRVGAPGLRARVHVDARLVERRGPAPAVARLRHRADARCRGRLRRRRARVGFRSPRFRASGSS